MSGGEPTTRTVIGLEIHVQLDTKTKLFCGCPVRFDAEPNSCVCPVCLGHPGALPVLNRKAFELAMLSGLALNCTLARFTKWDRKSYYYPDLPKNYQISQYDLPLAEHGWFEYSLGGSLRRVRIKRVHLEEDAGKSLHDAPDSHDPPAARDAPGCTLVDLNRCGTPLLEIVTEPDLTSAGDAYAFCTQLQRLVTYLGVSEGVMQKGQMRFEPNVNVVIETADGERRTPISEIKNLNSFRAVRGAISYEVERQVAAWRDDPGYLIGKRPNENRGFNEDKGVTEFQRSKEAAHDYRYFPDPDLVPVVVSDEMLQTVRAKLPELPAARTLRLVEQYGLSAEQAETIVQHRPTADLFERIIDAGGPPAVVGKQFVNVWLMHAKARKTDVTGLPVDVARMAELARMTADGVVSSTAANRIAEAMLTRPESPAALAGELGVMQVTDTESTAAWVDQALAASEQAVRDALDNPQKTKAAIGFLRGQVMKISGGKADPKLVGRLIEERLGRRD